jgi:raffinose/stachyose/melibiose transport system substrate-binding protein
MRSHSRGARRRLATVAVPMAAALLLAACGGDSGSEGNGEEPQTITFAIGSANPGEHHFQDIAAAYEKAHPGVKITIQKLPGESYATAIATRVQGGNAPDVFQSAAGAGQPHAVGNLGKANLLLKLTDPSFKEALPPGEDPTLFMYDGVVVGVPTSTAVNGIFSTTNSPSRTV